MLSFVALAWNEQVAAATALAAELLARHRDRAEGWNVVQESAGLVVSCRIASGASRFRQVYPLHHKSGVVLGKLFYQSHAPGEIPRPVALDAQQTSSIIQTEGRHLMRHYWGQYVAFLRDSTRRITWALRDPTGAVTCYMSSIGDVQCFFSRLEDFEQLGGPPTTLNRRGLISQIVLPIPCSRATGLNEITALLAGECAEVRSDSSKRSFYWNPLDIAASDAIEDVREAVQLTRQAVRACVHAWATCFDTIMHHLSGGLDSSIVLACLRDAPNAPSVICRNFYGRPGSRMDERQYARLAATTAGCELVESPISEEGLFEVRDILPPAPEPYLPTVVQNDSDMRVQSAMQSGVVPGYFDGEGGDEIFFHHSSDAPTLADFLRGHAFSRRAWQIALEDAAADRVALWRVMRAGLVKGVLRPQPWNFRRQQWQLVEASRQVDSPVPKMIRSEAYQDEQLWHPLFADDISVVPQGKAYHCMTLTIPSEMRAIQPAPDEALLPALVRPLRSQPLIELSLRIPTYVLRTGGQDRGVARRAFQGDLANEIIRRRSKGGGNEALHSALKRNIESVRRRLLNGALVDKGYLDRRTLAAELDLNNPTRLKIALPQIQRYFMTEVWLQRWSSEVPPA